MEKRKKILASNSLPLVPLRDIIVFPRMIIPLFVGRERSIRSLEYALSRDRLIFLSAQKSVKENNPLPEDIYQVGVIAEILQVLRLNDGTVKVLVEAVSRGRILSFLPNQEFYRVNILRVEESEESSPEIEALIRAIHSLFKQYTKTNPKIPPEVVESVLNINDPHQLIDTLGAYLIIKTSAKQKILELMDTTERLEELYEIIDSEVEILQIEKKVRGRVKKQMERSQKEYYLNEQMKAIQRELGREDDKTEIEELKEKIKKAKMPKEIEARARKELKKLELMPSLSAEATVVRNYIDWLIDLPWAVKTSDEIDLKQADKILNEDHFGLEKVKERILEYLAVRGLVKKMKGPILCFVGPPGVGKTSLGRSIARATGRKFIRISLGGMRDEAEIRGHRRTYIGALPGRIIQSLKKCGSKNPVFMLDEVDKMSMDFRGDPSSALLEVLDPEQNNAFSDHYLEVDFDLSEVMFITTANVLHSIPFPLQDRMEVLRIHGYTEEEKINIATQFLVSRKLKEHGLSEKNICFSPFVLKKIIRQYTREAGVRKIEKEIATICRKVARKIFEEKNKDLKVELRPQDLGEYLGIPRYQMDKIEDKNEVGLSTGLAWTEFGGDILVTEVLIMEGKGKLMLTGQLGEVMQESAQAALSYVRSRGSELGLQKNFYQKVDIHIHVPEGAIPKDGPSAGITMATALVSALTKRTVKRKVAMTGEITLRGRILGIGGVKEKLLAAHNLGGISTVILPKENKKDLKEIPAKVRKRLKIVLVETMDEVLKVALLPEKLSDDRVKIEKPTPAKKSYLEISSPQSPPPLN